jgi:hypothetical protein
MRDSQRVWIGLPYMLLQLSDAECISVAEYTRFTARPT